MRLCQALIASPTQSNKALQTDASRSLQTDTDVVHRQNYTGRKYVSKMYQNVGNIFPTSSNMVCQSHKLFLYASIMQQCHFGGFNLLPLGQRVYEKLVKIIDEEMEAIGCQKMSMTTLAPASLWKKTGRWDSLGKELFRLEDRKRSKFCLGPTHEEVVTNLMTTGVELSYRRLPMKLYQITRKFRDEYSAKYGFLRSREFEMKDLYTFDASVEEATETYHSVCEAYSRIFDRLELDYERVVGATGNIGGSMSHEYQLRADIGEDEIQVCKKCGFGANVETKDAREKKCTATPCGLEKVSSIEVGHSFLLGTKYSEAFGAKYSKSDGTKSLYEMGCYGLGVSRVIQACVEVLSPGKTIMWPRLLAPYQICIIPLESKSECLSIAESMSDELNQMTGLSNEVVIDDRHKIVSFRLFEARAIGYPFIIPVKDKALDDPSEFEVIDTRKNESTFMTREQIMDLASTIETV